MFIFLTVITVLLCIIAYQILLIFRQQQAMNRFIINVLTSTNFDNDNPRTVFEQIGKIAKSNNNSIEEVENILRYLRSYVWEVKDYRIREDILNPPTSIDWPKMRFRPIENPKRYGLWMREKDMNESFQREVVNAKNNDGSLTDLECKKSDSNS